MPSRVVNVLQGAVADGRHVAHFVHRPRDLAVLLGASGATTLILGVALAVSVHAVSGGRRSDSATLLIAYLAGAAAASAVPVPAGLGSTEAHLIAAVVSARVPVTQAVDAVLLFRAVTFWAPAPLGLVLTRILRRRGAL